MANFLDEQQYKILKKDVPTYNGNALLSILGNKQAEPTYPSIISPPVDNTVAQSAEANSSTPAQSTPVKYFPDTQITQSLPQTTPIVPKTPSTPASTPYVPQTEYEKYWGTPVGTSKYNMPLDKFTQIAGLAAKYLDPKNPVANDLIKMGAEASNERARREYESPNVLLQRQLHQTQLDAAKNGLEGQKKMGEFVNSWSQRELSLKEKGMTSEARDSEFIKGMIATIAPYAPEKAAVLQERMIEARENRKLKEYAQDMKDYFNELKIDQAITNGLRAERTAAEQVRHNKIMEKFRGEEVGIKKEKAEEDKTVPWYFSGTDAKTGRPIFTNKKGESKLGDLPEGVEKIAPKTEKPLTPVQQSLKDAMDRKKKRDEKKSDKVNTSTKPISGQYPEGTIIKNQAGKRMIMRNGQFVDYI